MVINDTYVIQNIKMRLFSNFFLKRHSNTSTPATIFKPFSCVLQENKLSQFFFSILALEVLACSLQLTPEYGT